MDQQAIDQNEQLLGQFLDNADKKFIGHVGMTALAIMTEKLPPDQYQAFLSECIENAHEIQKHKSLNANTKPQPQQQTTQGQPPAGSQ
jgi:hypothetical protein